MKMDFRKGACIGVVVLVFAPCFAGSLEVAEADFTVSSCDRLVRDYPVALDLTYAEGVEFDFKCDDFSPFLMFNCYLKSGDGWYALVMDVEERAGVQKIAIRKRDVKWKEGKPAGWHSISGVRLYGYRGNAIKASFAAENFRLLGEIAPKAGERRFIWCHSPWGLGWKDADWGKSARMIKGMGFTDVIVSLAWANGAYYASDVLPPSPQFLYRKEDAFDMCRAACSTNGLKMHAWMVCFNMGSSCAQKDADALAAAGRVQVDAKGGINARWLCPTHPENVRQVVQALAEMARKGADGVHLDYIRYPDGDFCHCARCTEAAKAYPSWDDFRATTISRVVKEASAAIRAVKPGVEVSAAVRNTVDGSSVRSVGQDWHAWCKAGWLDFVCPMDYTPLASCFRAQIERQKAEAAPAALYPGIGDVNRWPDPSRDAARVASFVRTVREAGIGGFCFFDFNRRAIAAFGGTMK